MIGEESSLNNWKHRWPGAVIIHWNGKYQIYTGLVINHGTLSNFYLECVVDPKSCDKGYDQWLEENAECRRQCRTNGGGASTCHIQAESSAGRPSGYMSSTDSAPNHSLRPGRVSSWCSYKWAKANKEAPPAHKDVLPDAAWQALEPVFACLNNEALLKRCSDGKT